MDTHSAIKYVTDEKGNIVFPLKLQIEKGNIVFPQQVNDINNMVL